MSRGADPIRVGVLSTARIADVILTAARRSGVATVIAVASRDGERARAWAEARGVERAHASYDALLADESVEVVYVPLPNALHVMWALRALEAGKAVLCEKPLARRGADAQAIVEAATRGGLVVTEGLMYRHHPLTERVAALIADGVIGRLAQIRARFSYILDDPSDVRLDATLEGGALADLGVYCLSYARLLAGEPTRAAAYATGQIGAETDLAAVLVHADDVTTQFDCSLRLPFQARIEIVGDAGHLTIDDPWVCRDPRLRLVRGSVVEDLEAPRADPYALQLADLRDAIRESRPPRIGAGEIVAQAHALEAVARAAETETWIRAARTDLRR